MNSGGNSSTAMLAKLTTLLFASSDASPVPEAVLTKCVDYTVLKSGSPGASKVQPAVLR